jgi:hypothetical protein
MGWQGSFILRDAYWEVSVEGFQKIFLAAAHGAAV